MTHWNNQARLWDLLGPPLKPSPDDIQNHLGWINEFLPRQQLAVLVLGVTPEIIQLPWQKNTRLISLDNNLVMIESVLPRKTPYIQPIPISANWLNLPLAESSIDLVIGDGCYNSLAGSNYSCLTKEIHRVLKPDGMCIMRFFLQAESRESIESIIKPFSSRQNFSFHAFKLRLLMGLQEKLNKGVHLRKVWEFWDNYFRTMVDEAKQQLGWSDAVISTIDNYKDSPVFYTFPRLTDVRKIVKQYFTEEEIFIPDYYLGDRCPTLKLRPHK